MLQALPLGRLLVTSGLLTQQALDEVLALQKSDGRRLGELLAEKGLVKPHQLAQFLSHQLACPWVSLQRVEVAREAVDVLPREVALRHHMVPVHLRTLAGSTALYVAMDDPTDDVALSEAAAAATMPVKPMVALSSEIRVVLDRLYLGGKGSSEAPKAPASGPGSNEPLKLASAPPSPTISTPPSPTISIKGASSPPPPRVHPSKPPKPPPPKPSAPPPRRDEPSILDDIDSLMLEDAAPSSRGRAVVMLVEPATSEAREPFLARCKGIGDKLGADVVVVPLAGAAKSVTARSPCAVVVAEEMYDVDPTGLDRLALELGVQLVVANAGSTTLGDQVERLLAGAITQWRRASYEKGAVLEHRYELLRDLGGRIPGSRWEVRHLKTARRSMLKVGVRAADDETDAEAVRREHQALARFQHPGAVDLRDAGTTDLGDPFIVVEMLEGRSLEGLVAARGALPLEEACALVRQAADALVAAHEAGVLHHRVRPEHVLVVRDPWGTERVKLVHWESATVADGPIQTAIDLAGLGACAFHALVGRSRDPGEDIFSADLLPSVAKVIARAIGGAAGKEFDSAKEFVDALEAAAPRQRDSMHVLEANPERRGSQKPARGSLEPSAQPQSGATQPIPKFQLEAAPASGKPASKKPDELRRYPRAPYRTPVRVEVAGFGAVDGRSEDISERGLFVVTRAKIADGAQVLVRFALPIDGKVVSESGVVRWSRAPGGGDGDPRAIGIELSAPGAESARQIGRYVSFMSSENK